MIKTFIFTSISSYQIFKNKTPPGCAPKTVFGAQNKKCPAMGILLCLMDESKKCLLII